MEEFCPGVWPRPTYSAGRGPGTWLSLIAGGGGAGRSCPWLVRAVAGRASILWTASHFCQTMKRLVLCGVQRRGEPCLTVAETRQSEGEGCLGSCVECLGSHKRAEWQVGPTGGFLPAPVSPSSRPYTQRFSSVNRL